MAISSSMRFPKFPNFMLVVLFPLSFCDAAPFLNLASIRGGGEYPYTLGVRDSFMIGHSFRGNPDFGPAANMHGATYTCDVEFKTDKLHETNNWVIDIGQALTILSEVLALYNFKNLDEVFPDESIMTTTEFMAEMVFRGIAERVKKECNFTGAINVKLWESHKAWASYEGSVM